MDKIKTFKSRPSNSPSKVSSNNVMNKINKINLSYLAKLESELDLYIEEILIHPKIHVQSGR